MKSNLNFDNSFPPGPGGALSRQVSKSLQQDTSMQYYHAVFSANNKQTGYLELRISGDRPGPWVKKWFTFEDGSLNFAESPFSKQDEYQTISMERVISLRADSNAKCPVITVTTLDGTFFLKAPDLDQMRQWLFSFQKSVALVITKLLYKRQRGYQEDSRIWGSALGDADGEGMDLARSQMRSAGGGGLKRGALVLDGPDRSQYGSSVPSPTSPFMRKTSQQQMNETIPASWNDDDTRDSPNRQAYSLSSSRMMAVSPAIPIGMGQLMREVTKTNLASSYKEETAAPINTYLRRNSHSNMHHRPSGDYGGDDDDVDDQAYDIGEGRGGSRDEDDEDGSRGSGGGSDDDDMMFDMDENVEEREEARHHQQHHQQQHALNNSNISGVSYDNQSGGYMNRSRKPTTGGSSVATSLSSTRSGGGLASDISRLVAHAGHSYLSWSCGSFSDTGVRDKNEDRYVQEPCVLKSAEEKARDVDALFYGGGDPGSCGYFAVYDGHGGDEASQYLTQELHQRLVRHELFHTNTEEAVMDVCRAIDKDFLGLCARLRKGSGTTALGAILLGSRLVVFNIGDSMAVLCSGGIAIEMSNSHKPGRADEAERIAQANGWITEEKELLMGRLHRMDLNDPVAVSRAQNMQWTTIHRVCGEISVSRSIGDPDYKNLVPGMKQEDWYFRWPEGHSQVLEADLLIPDPECKVHEITASDEFLVLASDGLWDVVMPVDAVKIIQSAFQENRSAEDAAEELCDLAIRLGSSDNVTVVIVRFLHHKS